MSFKLLDRFKDADFIEIIKGSSTSFLFLNAFGLFLGYVLTIIIAQFYGAQGLILCSSYNILKLFTLISKLGIDTSSIRFIA